MNLAMNLAITRVAAAGALLVAFTQGALAQTNVNPAQKFTWSENTGWLNWRDANADAQGVRQNATFLQGYIWGENIGWINTGNGSGPYTNAGHTTFGVNIGAGGALSGYAWGENVGWINFNTTPRIGAQGARYDSSARRLRGYAWGENIGWINLDDATNYVAFAPACCPGNADGNASVNFADITSVLLNFNTNYGSGTGPGDANCSGVVNFADITSILLNFNATCP